MKHTKIIIVFALLILIMNISKAQLTNGAIAPNFVLTDINGVEYNLYEDYLDKGKSVVLDFSTVWCTPCWNYHNTHTLKTIYDDYGPNGTDEMMVFYIEADGNSTINQLNGIGSGTKGDWVDGTPYPIILTDGSETITNDFKVPYYPTLYYICPNKKVREFKKNLTVEEIYNMKDNCVIDNDASLFLSNIKNEKLFYCEDTISIEANVMSVGTDNLKSFDMNIYSNGNKFYTENWTGDLTPYQFVEINKKFAYSEIPDITDTELQIKIENVNGGIDKDTANNSIIENFKDEDFINIRVIVKTDDKPEEIAWMLSDSLYNFIVSSKGEITTANGYDTTYYCANINKCYNLKMYDGGKNGITDGFVKIIDENDKEMILISGDDYTNNKLYKGICIDTTTITPPSKINELSKKNIKVYPNPADNQINFYLPYQSTEKINLMIYDNLGKMFYKDEFNKELKTISLDNFTNGIYYYRIIFEDDILSGKFIVK